LFLSLFLLSYNAIFFVFPLLLFIVFLITEILPKENSATSEATRRRQDKFRLFTPLALSGIMVILASNFLAVNWSGDSNYQWTEGIVLLCWGCPLGFIYILSIISLLTMFTRSQSQALAQESGDNTNTESLPSFIPSEKKANNYALRLLMMFGVIFLGCAILGSVSIFISMLTDNEMMKLLDKALSILVFLPIIGLESFGIFKLIQFLRK